MENPIRGVSSKACCARIDQMLLRALLRLHATGLSFWLFMIADGYKKEAH